MTTQSAPPQVCPRCSSALIFEKDWYGAYSTCIACGYVYEFGAASLQDLAQENPLRQRRRQPSHGKLRL